MTARLKRMPLAPGLVGGGRSPGTRPDIVKAFALAEELSAVMIAVVYLVPVVANFDFRDPLNCRDFVDIRD